MPKPRQYHRTSEDMLCQWSHTGDPLADFELHHRRTVRQMYLDVIADPPTSHAPDHYVIYLDEQAPLHFFKGLFGPPKSITMLLDPKTPKTAMNRVWHEIQAWRDRLERWQGSRDRSGAHYLRHFKRWHQAWAKGAKASPSLAELTRWVNTDIAGTLQDALEIAQEAHVDTPLNLIDRILEHPSWRIPRGHWAETLSYAIWILEQCGLPREEIRAQCLRALQRLKDGKLEDEAFEPNEPIDRDRLWGKLKRLDP